MMLAKYAPKTLEQKIGYLVEECGEVLAAVGKTQRWGFESWNPELPKHERETNREWILRELVDLERAIDLVRCGIIALTEGAPMRYRPLSAEERNIMEHATAWGHKSNPLYRNRYVIDPDCDSWGSS
jgi:hypothetical protein